MPGSSLPHPLFLINAGELDHFFESCKTEEKEVIFLDWERRTLDSIHLLLRIFLMQKKKKGRK